MKTGIMALVLSLVSNLIYAESGKFYGGIGIGKVDFESTINYDENLLPNQKLKDSSEFKELYWGYRFNQIVALEIGYADLNKVEQTYQLSPVGIASFFEPNNIEEIDINRVKLQVLGDYPVSDEFALFGLLGYAHFDLDRTISGGVTGYGLIEPGSDSEDGLFLGIGIKYKFNERFAIRLQSTKFDLGNVDSDDVGLSMEMMF